MKKIELKLIDPEGLHARPASSLSAVAMSGESNVSLHTNGQTVDMKSIMLLLSLGLTKGAEFSITVEGADEDIMFERIKKALVDDKFAAPIDKNKLKGIAASKGYAVGKVKVIREVEYNFSALQEYEYDIEVQKFNAVIEEITNELDTLYNETINTLGEENAKIFKAHIQILKDNEFQNECKKLLKSGHSVEYSILTSRNSLISRLSEVENSYIQERIADIKDVTDQLLNNLMNVKKTSIDENVILIAHDLGPSETATLDKEKILGFVTEIGGKTSHTAIIARTIGIPAIVGTKNITELNDNDIICVDGYSGEIFLNPNQETLEKFKDLIENEKIKNEKLQSISKNNTLTADGQNIELSVNIGTNTDFDNIEGIHYDSVGLYRTEVLFMNRDTAPTIEEQVELYKEAFIRNNSKPIVFRTLDVGGDKNISYIKQEKEMNPFLGVRGARLSIKDDSLIKDQFEALLKSTEFGLVRIMIPMITTIEEVIEIKKILKTIEDKIDVSGGNVKKYEFGIMIETPSAAIASSIFAKHVDFFSIGTNDLTQYTMAADRMNENLSSLDQPLSPALIRLYKSVIDSAHAKDIWVGMCGGLASIDYAVPLLLSLGLDEFSCDLSSVLEIKSMISKIDTRTLEDIQNTVFDMDTEQEIVSYLKEFSNKL